MKDKLIPTCERDRSGDGKDAGVTADVAELAVGATRKDLSAVATEKLDRRRRLGGDVIDAAKRSRGGDHHDWSFDL